MEYSNDIWESLIKLNDINSDLIMICDVRDIDNFKIIYVNKKMAESFNTEKDSLIGKNFWNIIPEFVAQVRKEQALKVMQSKKSLMFEDERFGRYFSNLYVPIFNENHEVVFGATITKEITEQKVTEKKYENLVDNINEGIFVISKTGKFTYVNKIMEKRSGITKDEFYKTNFFDIVLPEYKEKIIKQFTNLIRGKKVKQIEAVYLNRTGKLIHIEINANPVYENDKIVSIQGITRDITDLKIEEQKFKKSRQDYQDIFNRSIDGMLVADSNGIILDINSAAVKIFGYSRKEDLIGTEGIALYARPSQREEVFRILNEKGYITDYPVHFKRKDGKEIIVSCSEKIINNKKGEMEKVFSSFRDITEIEENRKKLNESEERWRSLVENIPKENRISIIDMDYTILYINRVQLGRNKHDVIGRNALEFSAPESRLETKKVLDNVFSSGKPARYESKSITPAGNTLVYEITAAPIKEKDSVTAVILMANDVTPLRKAESERKKLDERYRLLLENSGCPITYINLNGKIVLINEVGAKNLNGKPDDFIGESIYKLMPDYLEEEQKKRTNKILETGHGIIREDVIKLRSGNKWFLSYQQPVKEDNKIVGIQIFSIDITEQKNIENQIIETKNYLNNVIGNTKEIIFTINKDRRITLWNQSAEYVSGITYRHMKKKRFSEINFIENHKDVTNFIEDIFSKKTRKLEQLIIKDSDGSTNILKPSVSTIVDKDGDISDIIFICDDITDELGSHKQTVPGSSYIIDAVDTTDLRRLLTSFVNKRKNALFITREPVEIKSKYLKSNYMHIQIFSSLKHMIYPNVKNLDDLKNSIIDFIKNNKNPAIFIDRIDYLLFTYGFKELYLVLCEINDIIRKHKALFFIRLNRNLLSEKEYLMIMEEYPTFPSIHLDTIYLDGYLFELLEFVNKENESNRTVNQTKILKQFAITKITAQKRISRLLDMDLLLSKSMGRSKQLCITRKGKILVEGKN